MQVNNAKTAAAQVSETGVWSLSGNHTQNSQTDTQTPVRHLPLFSNENSGLEVSDKVSDTVCQPLNCHCLSGGVSLGRAKPDTPDKTAGRTV